MKNVLNPGSKLVGMFSFIIIFITCQTTFAMNCGEKPVSVKFYEQMSFYGLIAGFGLLIVGILLDKKGLKFGLFALSVIPFIAWGYANFLVDYSKFEKNEYNYK